MISKPDTFLLVHNAGAGDTKGEELTPSVMDNPRKRMWHLQCSARITGARSVFASTSRHPTACQEQRVGVRNTDQVASCRRALARISPIFQRGCAASRPTGLSEELATESLTFPHSFRLLVVRDPVAEAITFVTFIPHSNDRPRGAVQNVAVRPQPSSATEILTQKVGRAPKSAGTFRALRGSGQRSFCTSVAHDACALKTGPAKALLRDHPFGRSHLKADASSGYVGIRFYVRPLRQEVVIPIGESRYWAKFTNSRKRIICHS